MKSADYFYSNLTDRQTDNKRLTETDKHHRSHNLGIGGDNKMLLTNSSCQVYTGLQCSRRFSAVSSP